MLIYTTFQSILGRDPNSQMTPINVLVVSDCIENLTRLKSLLHVALPAGQYVQNLAELTALGKGVPEIIVIDIGTEYLAYALREVRTSSSLQDTPIFVRAERFVAACGERSSAQSLASSSINTTSLGRESVVTAICTKYRAVSGLDVDLVQLLSQQGQKRNNSYLGLSTAFSGLHPAR